MSAPEVVPARTEQMTVIHRIMRQGFPEVAGLVRRVPPGASARAEVVAAHLDFLLDSLHHHHSGEDENIWPLLLERVSPQAELVQRMARQHADVAERGVRVRALLADWRRDPDDGEELAAAIDEFTAALVEHLDDEEAHVVPLIREHITAEEWERFGEATFAKFTNPQKLVATGVLEDVATPEEATWFLGGLPLPIRIMWRLHGRRSYERHIARVRGREGVGRATRLIGPPANRLAVALYRRSGGRIGGSAKGIPVLLITVPGRRTGIPRTTPVAYIEHEGEYVVCGSAGGTRSEPQWFRNVRAATGVQLEIRDRHHDAEVTVPNRVDRDRLWRDVVLARAPFFEKYEEKAGRLMPLAVLTPDEAPQG